MTHIGIAIAAGSYCNCCCSLPPWFTHGGICAHHVHDMRGSLLCVMCIAGEEVVVKHIAQFCSATRAGLHAYRAARFRYCSFFGSASIRVHMLEFVLLQHS